MFEDEKKTGRPPIDITGERYGRLIAIEERYRIGTRSYWLCQCDCGNEVIAEKRDMRSGCTRSCGCLKREMLRTRNRRAGKATKMFNTY